MIVYLAGNQRWGSSGDGYAMACRAAPHKMVLQSYHYTDGINMPIHEKQTNQQPKAEHERQQHRS